jgi:hypothetical protein
MAYKHPGANGINSGAVRITTSGKHVRTIGSGIFIKSRPRIVNHMRGRIPRGHTTIIRLNETQILSAPRILRAALVGHSHAQVEARQRQVRAARRARRKNALRQRKLRVRTILLSYADIIEADGAPCRSHTTESANCRAACQTRRDSSLSDRRLV